MTLRALTQLPWRAAAQDWLRTDGITWAYMFKVLGAACLTYWLALRLEFPQPSTAMITVFIVMQPQSGSVIAKGVYRILGTLVGLLVAVTLIGLFGQNSEVFLLIISLWIGLCCALSAHYRNFQAYAFVLAGYTAVIVGVPALAHPQDVFMLAVWRALEIGLGIFCSAAISAIVLPQSASNSLRVAIRKRFGDFATFAIDALNDNLDAAAFKLHNRRFIAEVVGLENLRGISVFEDPMMHMRSGRLSRLNTEFMRCTTRFNALHQLLTRLRAEQQTAVLNALQPTLQQLAGLLSAYAGRGLSAEQGQALADALSAFEQQLKATTTPARLVLSAYGGGRLETLNFDTAVELLERLAEELHEYALTHGSLASNSHPRESSDAAYSSKTNSWVAFAAGTRGALLVGVLSAFWVLSAWPSGANVLITAAAGVSLAASTPNPRRTGLQMAIGGVLGSAAGLLAYFFVYPAIDGFSLLCFVIAPVILFGAFLTTRLSTFGIGLGFLITFTSGAIPANLTLYDVGSFFNSNLATVLGFWASAIAGAVLFPTNSNWSWKHLQLELRRQVAFAAFSPLARLRPRFESHTRDVLHHASVLSMSRPDVQQDLMRWLMSVQAVGHALIELRQTLSNTTGATAVPTDLHRVIDETAQALSALFETPDQLHRLSTLEHLNQAIATVSELTTHPRRVRLLSFLHFIRSTLLDPEAPFAQAPAVIQGASHAH